METFKTSEPVRLVVRNAAGRIEVQTVDGDHSEVDVRPMRDNEASRKAVADTRVEMRGEGKDAVLTIEVPKSSRLSFGSQAQVHVIASVPQGTTVDATGASADIEGRGRFGSVEATTASGDVHFDEAGGDARVRSASGDVAIKGIGGDASVQTASGDVELGQVAAGAKVQTASGDVHIGEARSSLKVQTASGDQSIDTVSRGQVGLQSASGDLRIGVRRDSIVWIDAKSISGSTKSDLEMMDAPPEGEGPQLEIRATTMSGDLYVFRSDAVPA